MPTATTINEMHLDGGAACLDFINSAFNTEKEVIVERLHSYRDLLILAERLSLLNKDILMALQKLSAEYREEAQQILITAKEVRHVMFKVFTALAHKQLEILNKKTLNALNDYLSSAFISQAFIVSHGQLKMTWKKSSVNLKLPLWAFLLSASEILLKKDQSYIKQCGACEWLFIDETKNHRRKWCDMQTCGSNEKSKRYYQRKKMNK